MFKLDLCTEKRYDDAKRCLQSAAKNHGKRWFTLNSLCVGHVRAVGSTFKGSPLISEFPNQHWSRSRRVVVVMEMCEHCTEAAADCCRKIMCQFLCVTCSQSCAVSQITTSPQVSCEKNFSSQVPNPYWACAREPGLSQTWAEPYLFSTVTLDGVRTLKVNLLKTYCITT